MKPKLFTLIDGPVVPVGHSVVLKSGEPAVVGAIGFHHKRNEPMYQLVVAGRKKSKGYWNAGFDVTSH